MTGGNDIAGCTRGIFDECLTNGYGGFDGNGLNLFHDLKDADAAFITFVAEFAAFGTENRQTLFNLVLRETLFQQRLFRDVEILFAVTA